MLDLLFREVFRIVGFEGHAIVAHAFWSMCTHLGVTVTRDFAVLFVQPVIKRGLLDNLPGVLNRSLWTEGDSLVLCERYTIQALLAIRSTPILLLSSCLPPVPKKQLIAMPSSQAKNQHQHIDLVLFYSLPHSPETHLSPTSPIEIPSSVFSSRSSPPVPMGLLEREIDEGSTSCGNFSTICHEE